MVIHCLGKQTRISHLKKKYLVLITYLYMISDTYKKSYLKLLHVQVKYIFDIKQIYINDVLFECNILRT